MDHGVFPVPCYFIYNFSICVHQEGWAVLLVFWFLIFFYIAMHILYCISFEVIAT